MKKLTTDREILQALLDGEKIRNPGWEYRSSVFLDANGIAVVETSGKIVRSFLNEYFEDCEIYEEPKELMTFLEAFKIGRLGQFICAIEGSPTKWMIYATDMQPFIKNCDGFAFLSIGELNKKQWWIE